MGIIQVSIIKNRIASIGMGAMIVFIAMVLVAGIAASVIIQTSSHLESQSLSTGRQTTGEVGNGLEVYSIEGFADNDSDISKLAIMIRPRAGTSEINLNYAFIELSNEDKKVILNYTNSYYYKPDGFKDIFTADTFPDNGTTAASQFGILVFSDLDSSMTQSTPIINRGDKVYLCINTTACFNDIPEKREIEGQIIPEQGNPGVINFVTPSTYAKNVMELQLDM